DFFQKQLDIINEISLKGNNNEIDIGKTIALIKGKNNTIILKSPFKMKILEVNEKLKKKPQSINKSVYNEGWLYKIQTDKIDGNIKDNLVSAADETLKLFIKKEKDNNALVADDCCPDFTKNSGVVRRKRK
ncbi:MAG: hypothetical protein ACFFD1_05900, partial [Candidatus Thorarchaeota archaeon]